MDDSTKRYILDVVENLNVLQDKKAELYEYIRKFTIKHKRPYTGFLGHPESTSSDTPELE